MIVDKHLALSGCKLTGPVGEFSGVSDMVYRIACARKQGFW
jgi:hypothetical protein